MVWSYHFGPKRVQTGMTPLLRKQRGEAAIRRFAQWIQQADPAGSE